MTATGIMLDSFAFDRWSRDVRARPHLIALFEAWGDQRFHAKHFAEVQRQGVKQHMVTWEPWNRQAQGGEDYSCDAIASGRHDEYVREWARRLQEFDLERVFLRFGHEMQGDWYPWSADPAAYVAAWRRIHALLRAADADNVRMVWSPNANLYQTFGKYMATVTPYWPGADVVDYVGVTSINFGGVKERPPEAFAQRALGLSWRMGRHFLLPEVNTAHQGRVAWLQRMRQWTLDNPERLAAVVVSQPEVSGGQASIADVGNVQWRVEADVWPGARPVVARWFRDLGAAR